jgi:hypothetical protein
MNVNSVKTNFGKYGIQQLLSMLPNKHIWHCNNTAKSFPLFLWNFHFLFQHIFKQSFNVIDC